MFKRPTRMRRACLAPALLAAAVISGCATTVSESERDTSGRFDGQWRVQLAKGTPQQSVGKWRLSCGDMSREFGVAVRNGEISIQMSNDPNDIHTAYVAKDGKFRLAAPTGTTTEASGLSDSSIYAGENTLILTGRLDDSTGNGRYTWGIKEFGNAGCTTRTTMSKRST